MEPHIQERDIIEIFHHKAQYFSSPLTLRYAGREQCYPMHHFGPAIRSQYLLHFILQGKGRFCVNNHSYELTANHAFLIRPGESAYYISDREQPWEYIWFAFDGTESEHILKNCGLWDNTPYLSYTPEDSLFAYLKEIIDELQNAVQNDYKLLGYMYLVFGFLAKNSNKELMLSGNSYLNSCLKYIHSNYSSNISVCDMADYIKIDRTYLYRLFIRELSLSPKQYLIQYRIKAASDLLRTTPLSISEIASACGFSDASSFGKHFLSYTGFTPRQYRSIDGDSQLSWKPI